MKQYSVKLKSNSAIAFGRFYTEEIPKLNGESGADYEKRTWQNRAHTDANNNVFIPALAFKNCLSSAAKYLGEKIPGQGKKTWTAKFESGLMVIDNVVIGKKADIKGMWLHVPSDGLKGGTKRVMKCFPTIETWEAEVLVYVTDETITKEVLKNHLAQAGNFIGLGSLRVQKGGILGLFTTGTVTEVKTSAAAA